MDGALSRVVAAAARYVADSNIDNTALFEDSLKTLIRHLDGVEVTGRLSLSNQFLRELLDYSPHILSANTSSAATRSKLLRLLFSLALYNVRIRRYLCGELHLCGPVFECLKMSLKEQLGPQNLIDILRLLQILTYERCLVLGIWTNDLISFLMSEITRNDEMEWMPYCIAILCNLARRSKSVCCRIKKSTSYKAFSRRVIKLLSHDSRIVVVSSLVLVGYLEEKVRDMVYCSQNIHETFQCVFNVLIMGDSECLMTRHVASDLLRRLVVSETQTISSVPVITSTGKDVMNYSFFNRCIQQTAELLVTLDPRLEETLKVYDVLLAFCSLPQLCSPVCSAILSCAPTEARLTTPLLAIAATVAIPIEDAIQPEISLKALRLLTFLVKEKLDAGEHIADVIAPEQILSLVDAAVKTCVETSKPEVVHQCQLITEGLRLAEVCTADEDLRNGLLEVTTAALCAHISETQLMTNPVVVFMEKPPSQRTEKTPEWGVYGVAVVLEMLRLLASLKDFSKLHKDQYWRSLKDPRLVSFLAYALAYGDHEMVHNALVIYTHCSQLQAFPSRWLGDLIASCSQSKQSQSDSGVISPNTSSDTRSRSCEPMDTAAVPALIVSPRRYSKENERALDDLLQRIRDGFNVNDAKMSDVLSAYDKKILLMERRERELELLLSAKDQALAQSEKLRMQFRGNGSNNNDVDMARVRSLISDCEALREKNDSISKDLEATRQLLEEKTAALNAELARVVQERDDLASEICQEREVVLSANKLTDDLKKKLEITSTALVERQGEVATLSKDKARLQELLDKTEAELAALQQTHVAEVKRLNADISLRNDTIDKLSREADEMRTRIAAKEQECEGHVRELESLRSHGQKTQADLERMKRLRDEMKRLAEGFE
ncbi:Protein CIP2A [Trichostrongylus colubriformis]|uniref:Protein CIP2A n=1 Tax=Trichostrongylus colubriformis TaxID=6319 RepID=A0AAN8G390_TRICO